MEDKKGICDDIDKPGLIRLGFNLIWLVFSMAMLSWGGEWSSESNRCYIGYIDGVPAASNVQYVFDDPPFDEMSDEYNRASYIAFYLLLILMFNTIVGFFVMCIVKRKWCCISIGIWYNRIYIVW